MRFSQIHTTIVAALFAFSASFSPALSGQEPSPRSLRTVCIDAGHGGHDPGAGSAIKEKTMTLHIAQCLERKIKAAYPDVKVIMTRDKDVYVTLKGRGTIANNANADLFISIHINSAKNKKASGFSIHCLGPSRDKNRDLFQWNEEVCRRENSVALLDDDGGFEGFNPDDPASTMIFSLMQNVHLEQSLQFAEDVQAQMRSGPIKHDRGVWQDPFMVLWVTSMPSVLIECGFITNSNDYNILKTETGRDGIAETIFKAFKAYKTRFDNSAQEVSGQGIQNNLPQEDPAPEEVPSSVVDEAQNQGFIYGAQVMAVGKLLAADDKIFKGYRATIVKTGKLYKYIIGTDTDVEKARENLKKIKKTFKDAFLVKTDGKSIEMVR